MDGRLERTDGTYEVRWSGVRNEKDDDGDEGMDTNKPSASRRGESSGGREGTQTAAAIRRYGYSTRECGGFFT